jgi:hypothetical protein
MSPLSVVNICFLHFSAQMLGAYIFIIVIFYVCMCVVKGMEPRASLMLGKCSTTMLYLQPLLYPFDELIPLSLYNDLSSCDDFDFRCMSDVRTQFLFPYSLVFISWGCCKLITSLPYI